MHVVLGANRESRREGIGLRLVLHLQPKADVAQRDAEPQRPARADAELPAEVERVRGAGAGREIATIAAAVDAKLHELVAEAEDERAGETGRVRGDELEVARRDARDRIAVGVGTIEIAIVDEVYRPADHADAVRRKVGAEHVTASRHERRAVEREFVVGKCRQTRRIPERRFASPLRGRCGLSHPDGLRADRKNQEQRTGVEGLLGG